MMVIYLMQTAEYPYGIADTLMGEICVSVFSAINAMTPPDFS
ncbi:MAG TPA: hypothetical protein VF148_17665 [Acidimicrobiia bacterium]